LKKLATALIKAANLSIFLWKIKAFYGIGIAEFIREEKHLAINYKKWVTRFSKEK